MLTMIIAAVAGVVGAGVVFGAGFGINKVAKKNRTKKIAKTYKTETLPELQNDAILSLAQHCGLANSEKFVALKGFEYDKDLHEQLLRNQFANDKKVSDKKISKTFRVK